MVEKIQKYFTALGTVNTIELITHDRKGGLEAVGETVNYISALSARLSIFNKESEITKLNDSAGGKFVEMSPDAVRLLKDSRRYSEELEGDFSVTVKPLTDIWKQNSDAGGWLEDRLAGIKVKRAESLVADKDILIQDSMVRLRRRGQGVDLGSIAKGYAADMAVAMLWDCDSFQPDRLLLNFGGTVVIRGQAAEVGIRNPFDRKSTIGAIRLENEACVTSGSYEQTFRRGDRYFSHILDPGTGYPAETDLVSVTAIGKSAEYLDAVTTAMFVRGLNGAARLASKCGMDAVFITKDGKVTATDGLRKRLTMMTDCEQKEATL